MTNAAATMGGETVIPSAAQRSNIFAQGGFAVFEGLASDLMQRMLLDEAMERRLSAHENRVAEPDAVEFRGGSPDRCFLSAPGGAAQDSFYLAPALHAALTRVSGLTVVPTGSRGTYSYYCRAGDFLGLHRDIDTCDLAVITCLHDGPVSAADSGALCLYPDRAREPLSAIRSSPLTGRALIRLAPGHSIVLLGGIVAHRLLPVVAGQNRVVSVLCFRAAQGWPGPAKGRGRDGTMVSAP